MTTENESVSAQTCREWRLAYREGQSAHRLAVDSETTRRTVREHLRGNCQHEGPEPPMADGRADAVDAVECRALRDRYAGGESIEQLEETTARGWQTLVKHLTGQCSHDEPVEAPTVEKAEILAYDPVTAEECARFRRGVRDAGSVMAFADTVDYQYGAVLAHVNGECDHDIDEPPREPASRSADLTAEQCREIREQYRADPAIEYDELADEHGCSRGTIERHVEFRCPHPPGDTIVTEVEAIQDLLETDGDDESAGPLTSTEILELETVTRGDPREPSRDLAEPDADRVETTRSRIIRNTELTHDLKSMYDHACQVCGAVRRGPDGEPYAEAHHLRPLGGPHEGPDSPGNVLVLCPNHHADFDYGRLTVDPETHVVAHTYDDEVDGTRLTVAEPHEIDDEYLAYHNRVVAGD